MARYATTIMVQGSCAWSDTVEASSPAEARKIAETKFWTGPQELRDALPNMDELNRACAEALIALMCKTRDLAKHHGLTTTARLSRAK